MQRMLVITILAAVLAQPALCETGLVVEFFTVSEKPLIYDVGLTGTVQATDTVEVGFRQGGKIDEVFVHAGDRVAKDQPLARTNPLQQEQSLRVAEASVAAAVAAEAQARQANDRALAMLSRGVGTRAELDTTNQMLSSAQRSLAEARSAHDQASRALDDTVITAPQDAIVTSRNAEPGQIVGAAQKVISLASSTGREAVFQTADTKLLQGAIGAKVTLTGIDFPDVQMSGHVTEIEPLVDPSTGSVTIRAKIDNPPTEFDLLGGPINGAVHFPAGEGISIPWTALTSVGDAPAVWIVGDDSRVSLLPVTIERFTSNAAILRAGLSPGQKVVGAGSQLLYPGREVRELPQPAPEAE